jgi:4-hydroxy-tetrahydrodipicolinate synthase
MFTGAFTALVTPLRDGRIDMEKAAELIEAQIAAGIDGIVPAGCTGEAATMTHDEQKDYIAEVVRIVNGRCKVVPGTGSNNTPEAIGLTKHAAAAGADGALVITPYYNKPTQEGLYRHYRALADAAAIPIVLYNVPGRTGATLAPETVARLAAVENVVALKEAGGSVDAVSQILARCDITVLSGDDGLTLPMMAVGAKGVVSVVSNLVPAEVKALTDAAARGDFAAARDVHYRLLPLVGGCFLPGENNPICVKTALQLLGRLNGDVRMPLCPMQPANVEKLKGILKAAGLLT